MWEYLEPLNYVQTIVIFVCKQISSDSFKNKITYDLQIICITILTVCKQMSSGSFRNVINKHAFTNHMYLEKLELNNLQELICHKTQPTNLSIQ